MKILGIKRNLDDLGRVTLPIELRRTFGIKEKDPVEIYVDNGAICLRPVDSTCDACEQVKENMVHIGKVKLCKECIASIPARKL